MQGVLTSGIKGNRKVLMPVNSATNGPAEMAQNVEHGQHWKRCERQARTWVSMVQRTQGLQQLPLPGGGTRYLAVASRGGILFLALHIHKPAQTHLHPVSQQAPVT